MRETILVADPNIDFLDQTRSILEQQNYQFIQAVNGEEAQFKLEQEDVDFLFVNTVLPLVDGITLCQFVREELQLPIPIMLMVGQGEAYPPPEALDIADGVLVRPIRPRELVSALHHLRVVRYFLQENIQLRQQLTDTPGNYTAPPAPEAPAPTPPPAPSEPAAPPEPHPDDTPLYPMSWFKKLATLEVKRAIRFHHPLSLLLLANDLTDEYLEQTPPDVLAYLSQSLAQSVRNSIRDIDIPVQFSRDHILILLPNTDIEGAISAASRIRGAVYTLLQQAYAPNYGMPPSISIGATTSSVQEHFKFTDLLRDATRALREVRAQGGDGVFYC